jgi:hypothetical protein
LLVTALPAMTTQKTRPPSRPVRRWARRCTVVGVVLALVIAGWLASHLRPRHDYFVQRHGSLVEASSARDPSPDTTQINELVHVRADTGLAVSFRVLRPADTGDDQLPLVVLLGGHRTGRNAVDVIGDCGGVAIAALDYPYAGPEKIRGVVQGVTSLPAIQRALLDTPPAVSLALDWLVTQPWVDRERIELVGVSLGTPFAAVAGALDPRFRRVWLIHGAARNREWIAGALHRKIASDTLRAPTAALIHLLAHGASFDTAHWVAKIAPRPVVVIGARQDESMTPANVEDLFAAAGEPKRLLWTDGGHVTRKRPEIVGELLALVRAQL